MARQQPGPPRAADRDPQVARCCHRLVLRVVADREGVARPGDVTALPQGHDAWVVGDEPVVVVDWYGASNYARG